jgi:hypothetical protein
MVTASQSVSGSSSKTNERMNVNRCRFVNNVTGSHDIFCDGSSTDNKETTIMVPPIVAKMDTASQCILNGRNSTKMVATTDTIFCTVLNKKTARNHKEYASKANNKDQKEIFNMFTNQQTRIQAED